MNAIRYFLQTLISLFFLYAGISKIMDPAAFSLAIERYQLVGGLLSWLAALWLPWLECIAGIGIWIKGWRSSSVLVLTGLVLAFQVALASALLRGLDISCGCFGSGMESGALLSFIRNFFLLGGLLVLLFSRPAKS